MIHSLIVGADGMVGAALFDYLKMRGHTVWGTTRRQRSDYPPYVCYFDLLDPLSEWQLPDQAFDVVYLCAGVVKMAACESDPISTYQVNVTGMLAIARYYAARGAFIVYLSTNQVFSGKEPFVSANTDHRPLNEYGRQKANMERYIQAEIPYSAIVRLTKVVATNLSLFNQWVNSLINNQAIEAFHDMVMAPVTLRQVVSVLAKIGKAKQPDCYQISGSTDIPYDEFAHKLAQYLECPASLVKSVSAIERGIHPNFLPQFTTLDCSGTMALSGEAMPHFSEVIEECFLKG